MTSCPTVSIGLPVYNGERFVERALLSLTSQTFEDYEILISDNGSTDRTEEICRDYVTDEARIRYTRHARNRGAAWNYNFTVSQASGPFFKWAAHDDECAPTFLARCLEAFANAGESTVLCYPRTVFIDEQGGVFARFLDNLSLPSDKPQNRLYRLLRVISRCNPVFGLIRTDALNHTKLIGSYVGADKVLLAELSLMGKFCEIPEYLFLRRMHAAISTAAAANERELLAWFDPDKRTWWPTQGTFRLGVAYVGAVARAKLNVAQRRACYRTLWRSWIHVRAADSDAFTQKIACVDAHDVETRVEGVKRMVDADDISAAAAECRAILIARPFTTSALHLMSIIEYRQGRFDAAREAALAAIWRNDRVAAFHNALGIIEKALGNEVSAIRAFEQAIACDTDYHEAINNLSAVYDDAGDTERVQPRLDLPMDEAIRSAAETALRNRLEEPVYLRFAEPLVNYEGARHYIYRAALDSPGRDARETVVVKWATPSTGLLMREWTALDFISKSANLPGHVPQIYCVDADQELAVMEDLGDSKEGLLGEILMGRDRARAVQALVAFSSQLADIHAYTFGMYDEWRSLTETLRAVEKLEHTIYKLEGTLTIFTEFSSALGRRPSAELDTEIQRIRAYLAEPGPFLALTHGDATPANFIYTERNSWIFDWETTDFRNCLLDGVFAQVRYLHSVWAKRISDDVRDTVQQAYREALSRRLPEAADDSLYQPHAAACTLTWLAGLLVFYRHVQNEDVRWGRTTLRQRMYTGLLHVNQLPELAKHFPNLAGQVDELCAYFGKQWPEEDRTMPLFPAFEHTSCH